jgi:glycerate kinase
MKSYLIAPNAFKHALSADKAAEAVARGILAEDPSAVCRLFPVGDGGDGTAELIRRHLGGESVSIPAADPLGRPRVVSYVLVEAGKTAVIEMASASGLRLLEHGERNPMAATSFGTGTLIRDALERGVGKVLVCVGGSATVDGGMGIMRALGARFEDASGQEVILPSELHLLDRVELTSMNNRKYGAEFHVLCDVRNPLLGPNGAAAVFGPQKGATHRMVEQLEAGLRRLCEVVRDLTQIDLAAIPYGGSAGGAAAGLHAFLGARLLSGTESYLDLTGFDRSLEGMDVVITGEGGLDAQTLEGKAPLGVATRAKRLGRRVIFLTGRVSPDIKAVSVPFDTVIDINEGQGPESDRLKETEQNLERAGRRIASLHS